MLRVLTHTLEFGRDDTAAKKEGRRVYVEILVLPFAYLISEHGSIVSELLKTVTKIKSMSKFHPQLQYLDDTPPTETFIHARSIIRLVSQEENCQGWLDSLFLPKELTTSDSTEGKMAGKWLALILVALLSEERPSFRDCAARCLERQIKSMPKVWSTESTKTLVASLVFLISQHPVDDVKATTARRFAAWMASCLYSLAALAATTTDTMRIVLRLIDSMNGTTKMRCMALKLMHEVWRNESRVFPRLESMLLEPTAADQDVELHVVKMATIKALCEKDPELGVQFISSIQGFLEDELETVVAMAMDTIAALCAGDCLDFYVAFKIIAQKMRKSKITCANSPLFLERLCCFYALGGAESTANEKLASKLLDQTWELADNNVASVRKSAYFVMGKFPLDMLGLCMPVNGQDSDDDDQLTEGEVEEQLDDMLQRLRSEQDADVRVEIEKLVARVLDSESTKFTAGVGRGQRMASAASSGSVAVVSAAATKEMRALLPTRVEVLALYPPASLTSTDWSGFLLAYRSNAVIDVANVKRKDKLVRLATQNVDELMVTVTTVLKHMELPWAMAGSSLDIDSTCHVFLSVQASMEGWKGFMATYVASLEELAELKTPVGIDDADVAFRVFSEGVESLTTLLLHDNSNKLGGALAAGALSVHFNLLPSSILEEFVTKCIERAAAVPDTNDLNVGFLVVASTNVLCRLEEFGGFSTTVGGYLVRFPEEEII
ncbi:hypothetical protein BBP00_00006106 [Phytophthora kernoviae]|uniref:DUF3730 domain-containing protein n=1 Tax=Phytophthora kernoviae TaxID=325452 RepID=A0A3F2RLZ5_9STRA|nr:hypothetical protein BBP00_00006106 [Phytophthora kernoviae]